MEDRIRRTYISILVIVTMICMLIGIFRMFGASPAGRGRRRGEEYSVEEFRSVKVEADNADVRVESGGECSVELVGDAKMSYAVENGKLTVTCRSRGIFDRGSSGTSAVITVASDIELERLDIETDLGNIIISDVSAEKVELETDAGNITLNRCGITDEGKLGSAMGNIRLEDVRFTDLKAETDLGNIVAELVSSERDCGLSLKTDLGRVKVDGESRGTEYEERNSGEKQFTAWTDLGNIDVSFR